VFYFITLCQNIEKNYLGVDHNVVYKLKMSQSIDIVIPVYQAENTIEELLNRIARVVNEFSLNLTVIVIDDGSSDDSWILILDWMKANPLRVNAIKLYKNYGQHPATMAGIHQSTGDLVVIMDCDLQDQPEAIPMMLEEIETSNSDLVVVRSRGRRNLLGKTSSFLFHKWSGSPTDVTTFRIVRRNLIDALLKYPEASRLSGPLLHEISSKTTYVNFQRSPRIEASRYTFGSRVRLAIDFILSRSSSIAVTFFILGSLVSLLSTIYMGIILYEVVAHRQPLPSGLNQIVVLVSFAISICSFGFGFLMLLMRDLLRYVKADPPYLVSKIEKNSVF
jgi:glycosyltransferase involved in cell wall biosynthesis